MKSTIVKKWDLKDRSDGVELRVEYKDGRRETLSFHDSDADDLSDALARVVGASDRPVTEGEHVR